MSHISPKHLTNNPFSKSDDSSESSANIELNGVYHLPTIIRHQSLVPIINKIITHNKQKDVSFIQIYCNSYGGSLDPTLSFIDVMEASSIPVYTIATGIVASAASLIFICGNKGNRVILKNTTVMTHVYSSIIAGNHKQLMNEMNYGKVIHNKMIDIYASHSKIKDKKKAEKIFLNDYDHYMTAADAVKYGIADKIATKLALD